MRNFARLLVILAIGMTLSDNVSAQGLSFSYLIPKDGYLSAPVSPFSVRGLGVDFGILELETGFSLYSVGGLGMSGLPFETDKPLVGPHFSLMVPFEVALVLDSRYLTFRVHGGGFGIYHLNPRLNEGNMDRAIRAHEGWAVANSDLSMENKVGIGWMTGAGLEFHVHPNFSLTAGISYLKGSTAAALEGTYSGAPQGENIQTVDASYPDAQIDFEGWELSLGVVLHTN